jgi:hypothetical protein
MHAEDLATRIAPAQRLLGYFDQQALAAYRNEPEKYTIETDSFEGSLTVTNAYYEELERTGRTDEYLDFKFGYRALASGELAVVLWLPDFAKAEAHQARWGGFLLLNPTWTDQSDERFGMWVSRYLEGSWEVDNGPRFYLAEALLKINGLTSEMVGLPLYRYSIDSNVTFPAGENTHRYQDAHKNLYGYLIDGIDKACIAKLALVSSGPDIIQVCPESSHEQSTKFNSFICGVGPKASVWMYVCRAEDHGCSVAEVSHTLS